MKLSCLQPGYGSEEQVWRKPGGVQRDAVRLVCEQTLTGGAGHCNFWSRGSDGSRTHLRSCSGSKQTSPERPVLACAVERRRFPVGASPTRQPLQPEAIGAVMEVTKWLKPSISVSRIGDSASVQAATRVNAEQALYGAFEVKHIFYTILYFLSFQFLCSTRNPVSSPRLTTPLT
jgi:hypothetical protein